MARNQISSVAFGQVNSNVRTLPGASVLVTNGNGATVTLYPSQDGTDTVANPYRADALGRYEFFVDASELVYTITVTLGPVSYSWEFYPPDNSASAGLIYELTWTDLVGRTANQDGAAAEVTNDSGTHQDATATGYDGGEVDNLGRYRWNEGWQRWVRVADQIAPVRGQPFQTVAEFEAASIPGNIYSVAVLGDGGELDVYIRSDSAADVQSDDGAWWARSNPSEGRVRGFPSRAQAVTALADGFLQPDGYSFSAGGLTYTFDSTSGNPIPDMPGVKHAGEQRIAHYSDVSDFAIVRERDVLDVSDPAFGAATGTGNDDTSAFTACFAAAEDEGIRSIYIPRTRSDYNLSSSVSTTTFMGDTTIFGDGNGARIYIGFNGSAFSVASTLTKFKGLEFESDRTSYPNVVAIDFAKTSNTDDMDGEVHGCKFVDISHAVNLTGRGLYFQNNVVARCDRAVVFDWPSSGVVPSDALHDIPYGYRKWILSGNNIHSTGIAFQNISSEVIRGAVIDGNVMDIGRGFWDGPISYSTFSGNVAENCNSDAISITGGGNFVTITGGIYGGMTADGTGTTNQPDHCIWINTGGSVQGVEISGVSLRECNNSAIVFNHEARACRVGGSIDKWNLAGGTNVPAIWLKGDVNATRVDAAIYLPDSSGIPVQVDGGIINRSRLDFTSRAASASAYATQPDTSSFAVVDGSREWVRGTLHIYGTGTPEGVEAAPVGSQFWRRNGGAGTTLYVKESGTGNTGWVAK